MNAFFDKSLREILAAACSSAPTPGGGSISAVVAALGASMAAMVANLTIGKEKYKAVEDEAQAIADQLMPLISSLETLVESDMTVFGKLMDAYRLPKNTDEEKANRNGILETALKRACHTPLEVARICVKVLELTAELAPLGNAMAISDAGVAAYVAEAALHSALLSVDINLPLITDQAYITQTIAEKEVLIEKAHTLKEQAVTTVRNRM
ncbi:MAG: Formiminotransferase-cyclodeaminase [Firmicutes bacterium]|nr:Formiminotransferase-cyclodeaminase [Bacillota bacterium]